MANPDHYALHGTAAGIIDSSGECACGYRQSQHRRKGGGRGSDHGSEILHFVFRFSLSQERPRTALGRSKRLSGIER